MDLEKTADGAIDVAASVKKFCRNVSVWANPNARVTRSKLAEILSEKEFYRQCVAFSFLEDSTLVRLEAYRQLVAEGRGDSTKVLIEATLAFLRHAQDLRRKDPSLLIPLGDYLQTKLGNESMFHIACCGPGGCFKIVIPTSDNPEA